MPIPITKINAAQSSIKDFLNKAFDKLLAEYGTLDNSNLDNAVHAPLGYTAEIVENIKGLLAALV